MLRWLPDLDRLLRGEATHPTRLADGELKIPALGLTWVAVLLGLTHGFCVGWYALFNHDDPGLLQLASTTVKVPALFLLTLFVTFPSLYVFNALVGSRLRFRTLLRLMVGTIAVSLAVLASFGPVVAFFAVSTTSYPFMVLLNVVACGAAGLLGLKFLHQTLGRLSVFDGARRRSLALGDPAGAPTSSLGAGQGADLGADLGALDSDPGAVLGTHVRVVFAVWMVVFGLVGAQTGWILRPFIGRPGAEFTFLREREGNFFDAVARTLSSLLG